jgi:hypothetical protein
MLQRFFKEIKEYFMQKGSYNLPTKCYQVLYVIWRLYN